MASAQSLAISQWLSNCGVSYVYEENDMMQIIYGNLRTYEFVAAYKK